MCTSLLDNHSTALNMPENGREDVVGMPEARCRLGAKRGKGKKHLIRCANRVWVYSEIIHQLYVVVTHLLDMKMRSLSSHFTCC